jgi:hypothetical protein
MSKTHFLTFLVYSRKAQNNFENSEKKTTFREDNLYGRRPQGKMTQIAGNGENLIFS